eukprot:Nk52_evm60s164 gene=Nk52_evmTU60s164
MLKNEFESFCEAMKGWDRLGYKGLPILNELVNTQLAMDYVLEKGKESCWGALAGSKNAVESFSCNNYDHFLKTAEQLDALLKDYGILLKRMSSVYERLDEEWRNIFNGTLYSSEFAGKDEEMQKAIERLCTVDPSPFSRTLPFPKLLEFFKEILDWYERDLNLRKNLREDVAVFEKRDTLLYILTVWQYSPLLDSPMRSRIETFFAQEVL